MALIEAIGAAPGDRPRPLAAGWPISTTATRPTPRIAVTIVSLADARSSDDRFEALLGWLVARRGKAAASAAGRAPRPRTLVRAADGRRLAELGRGRGTLTLKLRTKDPDGFDDWLAENLPEIHRDWLARRGG